MQKPIKFSHKAMATEFEILLFEDRVQGELVSGAVFEEIDRVEQNISYFIPSSDVFQFNRLAAGKSLNLGVPAFECFRLAKEIYNQTSGAFDPTTGALITGRRPWDEGEENPIGGIVPPEHQDVVQVGMDAIVIDQKNHCATKLAEGISVDFGGIGKGYALDQAKIVLDDWGIETALIHAGQSTSLPLGTLPNQDGWPMRILDPSKEKDELARFVARNMAVSASALAKESQILNPYSGESPDTRFGVWTIAETGAIADALSTSFMIMDINDIQRFCEENAKVCVFLVENEDDKLEIKYFGDWQRFFLELV